MSTSVSQSRKMKVQKIIQNHVYTAMGVGMIPVPLVDLIAISGVQLNMLKKFGQLYDTPFSRDIAKSSIATLLGGVIPVSLSGVLASMIKAVPIVGHTTAAIVMPAASGAMTYAVGKVFVQHFESGGTFLNFKPEEVRAYYQKMFEEGEKVASHVSSESKTSESPKESRVEPDSPRRTEVKATKKATSKGMKKTEKK